MPVPAPNLFPPFNIVRLSHVELAVTDLAWSRAFYVDTLGLQVTHEDGAAIYLRAMEERGHHCLILRRAEAPSVAVLGFKVWAEEDLDKAARWFASRGLPVDWISRPFMGRVLRTRDRGACRWSSTRRWTACRRSTSTIACIAGSSRCGLTISTCSPQTSIRRWPSIPRSASA